MKKIFKIGGKLLKGLAIKALHVAPITGTIISVFERDTPKSPKGKLNFEAWDIYKLIIGLAVGYVLYRGLLGMDEINFVLSLMGF